ncbi:MAG: ribosomal RNA small subunit methyltransferase A [Pedosphaera sp.]|nr:ribosomal RNA small subunit methyltransferase A [Pedosphaera sp.]
MTLTEMKQVLRQHDLRLTKSLGQNFLHDGNQLRKIVAAAELRADDTVLEIGPGLGPLTELLLKGAAKVLAIEKDARLVPLLRERLSAATSLELVEADALEWLRSEPRSWAGWKLVANLPYSVGSPILVELAQAKQPPDRLVVTLQWEVVRRIKAAPATDDYGLLTLLLQLRYEPTDWFRIPASCFFPPPDIDSACVTLVRRTRPFLEASLESRFEKIVRRAISQRRKQMFKLLREDWPVELLTDGFRAAAIPPNVRAESVSVEQFALLTKFLAR